jgi:hypothetical protein
MNYATDLQVRIAALEARVTRLEQSSAPAPARAHARGHDRPATASEVVSYMATPEINRPASDAQYLFALWETNGFTHNNKPVKNWKAQVRAWKYGGYFPSQKQAGWKKHGQLALADKPQRQAWQIQSDLDSLKAQLNKLAARIPFGTSQEAEQARAAWKETADGQEYRRLTARRNELTEELRRAL